MYSFERTPYGFREVLGGLITGNELTRWLEDKEKLIAQINGPYSVLVDARTMLPLSREDQQLIEALLTRMKDNNLVRMAIITASPVVELRGKQMCFDTGTIDKMTFIDASQNQNWERIALEWIVNGTTATSNASITEPVR